MTPNNSETAAHDAASDADELILQARARSLAQVPVEAVDTESVEVVAFMLAYETYGIETVYVNEVYPLKHLTPLPCTPPFVAGIINAHGQVLSVIDIKTFFELPAKGLTDLNKVIIISHGAMKFGILADAVLDVRTIPLGTIQPALPTLSGIREHYLRGITPDRLIILDAVNLLTDPGIIVREDVA